MLHSFSQYLFQSQYQTTLFQKLQFQNQGLPQMSSINCFQAPAIRLLYTLFLYFFTESLQGCFSFLSQFFSLLDILAFYLGVRVQQFVYLKKNVKILIKKINVKYDFLNFLFGLIIAKYIADREWQNDRRELKLVQSTDILSLLGKNP